MSDKKKIVSFDIEFVNSGSDAGIVFDVTCPECHQVVRCGKYQWWKSECICGYIWTIDINAEGRIRD